MKKTKLVVMLLFAVIILYNSCTKDNASDKRDIFVGNYRVTETWTENSKTLTKPAFTISIQKATKNSDNILLNNFANYGSGVTVEAKVEGKDITIPQQTLPNLKVIDGTGTVTDSTLVFTYTELINSLSIVVSANAKKW